MKTVLINSERSSMDNLFPEDEYEIIHSKAWRHCDLLVLVGDSSDVNPSRYNAIPSQYCGKINHKQDEQAFALIEEANKNLVPIVGICKGAQQLCVSKGGYLIQHVPRIGTHVIVDATRGVKISNVSADHHQVMVHKECVGSDVLMRNYETCYPEVIQWDYGQKKDLAIQFHPEWCVENHAIRLWFNGYLKQEIL